MLKCEICGQKADTHHIVYKSQGGLDFPINYKCLCYEHHRGRLGPHHNKRIDLMYKLQMQDELKKVLPKEYYSIEELSLILQISKCSLKKILKEYKLFKEGYKKTDIIYRLMGKKIYNDYMLEEIYDII